MFLSHLSAAKDERCCPHLTSLLCLGIEWRLFISPPNKDINELKAVHICELQGPLRLLISKLPCRFPLLLLPPPLYPATKNHTRDYRGGGDCVCVLLCCSNEPWLWILIHSRPTFLARGMGGVWVRGAEIWSEYASSLTKHLLLLGTVNKTDPEANASDLLASQHEFWFKQFTFLFQ